MSEEVKVALRTAKQADEAVEEARNLADPQALRQVQSLLEKAREELDRCWEQADLDPIIRKQLQTARDQVSRNQEIMREVVSISNPAEFQQW